MIGARHGAVLAALLLLDACTVAPPTGPRVLVLPSPGKDLGQFNAEDATCRNYAQQSIGNGSPQQAANQAAVGSAVIGTGLGAVAGALLGSVSGHAGAGAAIGAGGGLLAGSAVGAGNANASAGGMQRAYDTTYLQCMVSYRQPAAEHGATAAGVPYPPPPPPLGYSAANRPLTALAAACAGATRRAPVMSVVARQRAPAGPA